MFGVGIGLTLPNGYNFSPKNISGMVLWLRADKGTTIATGVSAWADQSGTGDANKNMAQATGAKQPTLNASDVAYNNKPTLSFSRAAAQYLQSGVWASALSQPNTTFIVGNDDGTAAFQYYCDGKVNNQQVLYNTSGATYSAYAGVDLAAGGVSNAPRVLGATFNGATSKQYNNARTPVASGNAGANGITGFTAGCSGGASAALALNGKIAEVIIYNSVLSAANVTAVMNYLGSRYGITIGA